jgi:hypothetical protein
MSFDFRLKYISMQRGQWNHLEIVFPKPSHYGGKNTYYFNNRAALTLALTVDHSLVTALFNNVLF